MSDGAELRERDVAYEFGSIIADVVEGGVEVAGVPGEDCVGDELEAEGVATVVVLVGGWLLALTERDGSWRDDRRGERVGTLARLTSSATALWDGREKRMGHGHVPATADSYAGHYDTKPTEPRVSSGHVGAATPASAHPRPSNVSDSDEPCHDDRSCRTDAGCRSGR